MNGIWIDIALHSPFYTKTKGPSLSAKIIMPAKSFFLLISIHFSLFIFLTNYLSFFLSSCSVHYINIAFFLTHSFTISSVYYSVFKFHFLFSIFRLIRISPRWERIKNGDKSWQNWRHKNLAIGSFQFFITFREFVMPF